MYLLADIRGIPDRRKGKDRNHKGQEQVSDFISEWMLTFLRNFINRGKQTRVS